MIAQVLCSHSPSEAFRKNFDSIFWNSLSAPKVTFRADYDSTVFHYVHARAVIISILVGCSSSIECRKGHRKWRILTPAPVGPVLTTTTAARPQRFTL